MSHGSRLPEAQDTVLALREIVVSRGNFDLVEVAALQFHQPDLPATLKNVIGAGVGRVVIVPLFLFNGVHMQTDLPEILQEQRSLYPDVEISVTGNIGADPLLAEIILNRIGEV